MPPRDGGAGGAGGVGGGGKGGSIGGSGGIGGGPTDGPGLDGPDFDRPPDIVCTAGDPRPECHRITRISVSPDGVVREVDLDNQIAHTICYRAFGQLADGRIADLTDVALWSTDRPDLGRFAMSNCFVTSRTLAAGGVVTIGAQHGSLRGEATLILKLIGSWRDVGVGPGSFAGPPSTDPAARPVVVYPLDGSMHPRNLGGMVLQFHAGAGNQVFRARIVSPQLDYTFYFRPTKCETDQCRWDVPADRWRLIAATNGGTSATLVLSGTSNLSAGAVAQADPLSIAFSPEDVRGGLYYFSTSLPGILRIPFGKTVARRSTPFIAPNTTSNPRQCTGCHDVTGDGSKVAATYGSGDDFLGITQAADADKFLTLPPPTNTAQKACGSVSTDVCSNFQTFNADGTKILSNFNGELIVRDGNTGAEVGRVLKTDIHPIDPARQRAIMPDWSHAGDRIAFVRLMPESGTFYEVARGYTRKPGGDWLATDTGEIAILPVSGNTFGAAKVVVPISAEKKEYHYYPAFSPDDQWLVFNTGTRPGYSPIAQDVTSGYSYGVDPAKLVTYDQQTSRLRLVRSTGGGPVDLARATSGSGVTASMPSFAPFMQQGGSLLFVTYSMKRDYGFVVTGGQLPQLWMAAIDLRRIGDGSADPSYAPVWLPAQDYSKANLEPVWTTRIACAGDQKCGLQERCLGGQCVANDVIAP